MKSNQSKPLTKSRFKVALECPTRLYYLANNGVYFNANDGNDFLQALADGGNQIGELAKYLYSDNPVGEQITVESLKYAPALAETQKRMASSQRSVIAEAAIKYAHFFIRVDILVHDPAAKTLRVIEVKSRGVDDKTISNRFKKSRGKFDPAWLSYLYDVAFQTRVVQLAYPDYRVLPFLVVPDKEQACDVDGLHQRFPIDIGADPDDGEKRPVIRTEVGTTRELLGSLNILREVDVSDVVEELMGAPVTTPFVPKEASADMQSFMNWASALQLSGQRWFGGVSKACRSCQFRADSSEAKSSGVHECWSDAISTGQLNGRREIVSRDRPLSIDIWGGGAGAISLAQVMIDARRAYVSDIEVSDLPVPKKENKGLMGMSPPERRMAQIEAEKGSAPSVFLNADALSEMDSWKWPLHMIDFETSAPALPFFKGMRPYETLAFQFSHHVMERTRDGGIKVRHANQWISASANTFPSFAFVRALRGALMPGGTLKGTVFRYHNHENTVLRKLRALINRRGSVDVADAADLVSFIDLITCSTEDDANGSHEGERQMVDLHKFVQRAYYSKHAGGSISLKEVLPAILNDAPRLASFYAQPGIYGRGLMVHSLNFEDPKGHVWLRAECGGNPYKTLPPVFQPSHGEINNLLVRLLGKDGEEGSISEGGLAMMAYNYTQFNSLSAKERTSIEHALLKYCELDTLAMTMLVQGLFELGGYPLNSN